MNMKTLVAGLLPVRVPHSTAGNRNRTKSAKNPIACTAYSLADQRSNT